MKKLHLLMLAVFLSITGQCFGEWKLNGYNNNLDSYIDNSRIKNEGLFTSMWELRDYKSAQTSASGKQYKSSLGKRIIDCQGLRYQTVALSLYSEQMGNGQIVGQASYQIKESDWENSPGSTGALLIAKVCFSDGNTKYPVGKSQDIKRLKCIGLGLAPNSADFQQCVK